MSRTTAKNLLLCLFISCLSALACNDCAEAQVSLRGRLKRVGPAYKLILDDSTVEDENLAELEDVLYKDVILISLNRTAITNAGLRYLKQLPRLREVQLADTKISDEGISYLSSITSLKDLNLARTKCSDIALYHLRDLSLKKLNLEGTNITDHGLKSLKGMNELAELVLGATAITNDGIVTLRGRPIRRLDLRLTNINDGVIVYLTSFPLERVILFDTKVTDAGIGALHKALPALSINGREGAR